MDINRQNYEIWFIDFLDGNLDETSKEAFYAFLKANPDLGQQLQSVENIYLKPDAVIFSRKNRLQFSEADLMGIDQADFLLIKQMEEGLNHAEELELAEQISNDESFIKQGKQYQNTKLVAEKRVFTGKSSLFQNRIRPVYKLIGRIAAAVAVVLLLVTVDYQYFFGTDDGSQMAMISMEPMPGTFPEPDIRVPKLADINATSNEEKVVLSEVKVEQNNYGASDPAQDKNRSYEIGKMPMVRLVLRAPEVKLAVAMPNAYEAGLRHMMPLYLDLNNQRYALVAYQQSESRQSFDDNFLVKGLQFVDRVGGDLINFDRLYDKDGNYVAYNFKAGNIEMKQKVRR
jgi:hypothetical protein